MIAISGLGLGLTAATPGRAQSALPSLGEDHAMTPAAERALGERIARELYRDPDYLDDPLLGEYVQDMWQTLLKAARARGELTAEIDERYAWTVLLGRDRSVNAFALPGGYFGLHLGLIGLVASRDELASVLAHELSHVTQRHIARSMSQQSRQAPWLMGAMILGALAASKNPEIANALITGGQAAAIQGQLNYSRDMEREADRIGFGVLTDAGFAPQGAVSMFDKLQQASRLNDNGSYPYLRTHPLTTQRIADLQARLALERRPSGESPPPDTVHALLAARARALSQPGVDTLRLWMGQADASGTAQQAPLAQTVALAQAVHAGLQLREFAQARRWLERLQSRLQPDPAAARIARLLGAELALAEDRPAQALQLLAADGAAASRRPEVLLLAQAQIATGAADRAAQGLQLWVAGHPLDATAWQTLGSAYQAQGQRLQAIRADAEAQAARLDLPAALDRLKAAQDLLRQGARSGAAAEHIEASIIDARLRQLEARSREQALQR